MNPIRKQQIVAAIAERKAARRLSQNQTARELGLSAAQLSNVLNAEQHGKVSDKLWRQLEHQLGLAGGWSVVETGNFNSITALCADTRHRSRMTGIIGRSGYGKTTALRHVAATTPATFYVFCDSLMTKRDFLEEIAAACGLQAEGNVSRLQRAISDFLATQDRPLLIFDDAGKLKPACHEIVQRLYDAGTGRLGLVLAGTPALKQWLDKAVRRGKIGADEYDRRIEYWLTLERPDADTIAHFCRANGIDTGDCIAYVERTAGNYGTLKAIITNARLLADSEAVTLDILEQVAVRRRA